MMTGPARRRGRSLFPVSPWGCQTAPISRRDVCARPSVGCWVSVKGTAVSCASWSSSQAKNAGARYALPCAGEHRTMSYRERHVVPSQDFTAQLGNEVTPASRARNRGRRPTLKEIPPYVVRRTEAPPGNAENASCNQRPRAPLFVPVPRQNRRRAGITTIR